MSEHNCMRIVSRDSSPPERKRWSTEEQWVRDVRHILDRVREQGDRALIEFTHRFDRINLDVEQLEVPQHAWQEAYDRVTPQFLEALRIAKNNIEQFHRAQLHSSFMETRRDGSIVGQLIRPLHRVGVYVPGGSAAYPSSVLMNVIPAVVAGVKEIVMVTPPGTAGQATIHPAILVAAAEAGVTELYRVGGAQAIAALAYGTQRIARVDKIVGPGNQYVALAKRWVYGEVDIDAVAGPSEIVVIADEQAHIDAVAADLLSQAEHDTEAMAVCMTTSETMAQEIASAVERQLASLPRAAIAREALSKHGYIQVVAQLSDAFRESNALAPEHLVVHVEDPFRYLSFIEHAGAIFLGTYSAETVGDYMAGPNHVLPTYGTARFASPLGVDSFMKRSSVIYYSEQALREQGPHMMTLARTEGLEAHARAIAVRLSPSS